VTTPESGTTRYTYDANGNVLTRTDARGVVTTYTYDALNRLVTKGYSDGTPYAHFFYDGSAAGIRSWTSPPLANTRGRLMATCTNASSSQECTSADTTTATVYSYDAVGRVVQYWQCTPYNCGTVPWEMDYSYDLAGM